MRYVGRGLGPLISEPGRLASWSLASMIAGATVSGWATGSAALVAAGLLVGVVPAWSARHDVVVRVVAATATVWLVYGALVGSLPATVGTLGDWATTEGRILVSMSAIVVATAITTTAPLRRLLVLACGIVTTAHAAALVVYVARIDVPVFPIELRRLFFGLASSHHVVAFLSTGVALIALAAPRVVGRWTWPTLAVAVSSIVLSGSRTSLLGLVAGAVVVAWYRVDRRRFWQVCGVGLALLAIVVAVNGRFRTTARDAVDPDFLAAAAESFRTGDEAVAKANADSEAEANALLRIAYWGAAADDVANSPIVGMGAFRQNDDDLDFTGVRGVVYVATDGVDRFNDSEPHNVVLYLLQEVGLLGLALFTTPYVIAWRRARIERSSLAADTALEPDTGGAPVHDPVLDPASTAALVHSTVVAAAAMSMVSSGVLATGLGIIANAIVFSTAAVVAAARAVPTERHPEPVA